jgi:seryl-tRNA synthetase
LLHIAYSFQPWRFENIFEQDIDCSLPSHKQTTIELSDHLYNDKMLLLDEMQKLKEQLKSLNEKYSKLQKRHEDVLRQLNSCNETSKAQKKTQTVMNRLENDARELKPLAVFVLDQLFNYSLKRPKWSEATIRQ